jgi:HSP20 family protein
MRIDPFRQFEQIMEQNVAGARTPRAVPMTALRRGDAFTVDLDLPGVVEDDIELTVERNVVTVRAHRTPARQDGDEVIIDERPYGEFTRQLFLGDNLDAGRMTADLRDGVLRLTIPVSEESKPRRIPLGSSGDQQPAEVSTSTG